MKITNTQCYCDKCHKEMSKYEYENIAIKLIIRVEIPHPEGKCGEVSGISMKLCEECSKELGLENKDEYHRYMDSQTRFNRALEKCKKNIFGLFREKIKTGQ